MRLIDQNKVWRRNYVISAFPDRLDASKGGLNQIDLTNVKKRGGEFIESDLATAASDPELVRKTVAEIVELSADRKSWLVFSSGVNHAYMLKDEFEAHDIDVGVPIRP